MYLKKIKNKGAIELSIGTVVIIVLAMSMLILGLVLIRNIFTGATDSVNILDDKVRSAISSLFTDETKDVVVLLGQDKLAKIKPGSGKFGIGIGARTPDGGETNGRERLEYKISLEDPTGKNCIDSKLLGNTRTKDLFITPLDQWRKFDEYESSQEYAIIEVDIPKGTVSCSQKVYVDVRDTEDNNRVYGGSFFTINILKEGIF